MVPYTVDQYNIVVPQKMGQNNNTIVPALLGIGPNIAYITKSKVKSRARDGKADKPLIRKIQAKAHNTTYRLLPYSNLQPFSITEHLYTLKVKIHINT